MGHLSKASVFISKKKKKDAVNKFSLHLIKQSYEGKKHIN